jgi:hypothetical protein
MPDGVPHKTLQARWESRSGKDWVALYTDRFGAVYESDNGGGNLGNLTAAQAVAKMEAEVATGRFQPDKAKTPMRRVV